MAAATIPNVRDGVPVLVASSPRLAGPRASTSNTPISVAAKRYFAAMKPMAIFIMGSGVTDMNPSAGWYNLGLLNDQPPLSGPGGMSLMGASLRFWYSRTSSRSCASLVCCYRQRALIVRFADLKAAPSDTARHRRRGDHLSVNFAPLVA